ncbi:MAG TPA: DUF4124 domain-containing protein [Burkholderiales bacterium]|nr:DUF4124 domain-containing protein [Burkholderiales bacterium]
MRTLFLVLALAALPAWAQQYKWVDKDGRVRYGDVPPPGVNAQRLKAPSGPAAPAPSAAAKKGEKAMTPEQAFQKRQQDAAKDAEKQASADAEAQAKRENCQRAQESLRTYESGQRISRVDSKGERYYLDDAQIQQGAAQARQIAQQACN